MKISIGADPGTSNFGYSVMSFCKPRGQLLRFDLLEIGMFLSTITNLTSKEQKPPKSKRRKTKPLVMIKAFSNQFDEYIAEWNNILDCYPSIKISSERFQSRGLRGPVIECVAMMNGAIATISKQNSIDYEIITAASWKNILNKTPYMVSTFVPTTEMITKNKGKFLKPLEVVYQAVTLPPHIVDAVFINIQGVLNKYKLKWTDVDIDHVVRQLKEYNYEK